MAINDVTHSEVLGTMLTGTLATLYTVPASRVMIGLEIVLCNIDTATTYYPEVQLITSGGSAGNQYKIVSAQSAGANGMLPGESRSYSFNPMAAAAAFIQAKADTTTKISFRAGITLKEV